MLGSSPLARQGFRKVAEVDGIMCEVCWITPVDSYWFHFGFVLPRLEDFRRITAMSIGHFLHQFLIICQNTIVVKKISSHTFAVFRCQMLDTECSETSQPSFTILGSKFGQDVLAHVKVLVVGILTVHRGNPDFLGVNPAKTSRSMQQSR